MNTTNSEYRTVLSTLLILMLLFIFTGPANAYDRSGTNYIRAGLGVSLTRDAVFADENSFSTSPAAYFGPVSGPDGKPIGAYGDFDESLAVEAGIGREFNKWVRAEISLSYRPDLEFDGQANFLGVALGQQPVHSDVETFSAMVIGSFSLAPLIKNFPLKPFLSAGLGVAHNKTDQMIYDFPTLGAGRRTVTQGGSSTDFAWCLGAGVLYDLTEKISAELTYRYTDLGEVRTDSGDIIIYRPPAATLYIPVVETWADLKSHEIILSFRYHF